MQITLHSNNINRDSGIEIPEAWIFTIRKHNSRLSTKRQRSTSQSDYIMRQTNKRSFPILHHDEQYSHLNDKKKKTTSDRAPPGI